MLIRDVMTRPVVSVSPATALPDAIALLTEHRFSALPVVDDAGLVVGILSESDALRAGYENRSRQVTEMMSTPVAVIGPGDDVSIAAERMLADRLRCIPVVEMGLLIGVITRRDLLRTMIRDDEVIASKIRALLDDYAGSHRQWRVDVADGRVVVGGWFADDAEQRIVHALAQTIGGVRHTDVEATWGTATATGD